MLAWDAAILGSGNAITSKATGIEPFTNGAGCNLTDLCYMASSEDRPHGGLSNQISLPTRGSVRPSCVPPNGGRQSIATESVTWRHRLGRGFITWSREWDESCGLIRPILHVEKIKRDLLGGCIACEYEAPSKLRSESGRPTTEANRLSIRLKRAQSVRIAVFPPQIVVDGLSIVASLQSTRGTQRV